MNREWKPGDVAWLKGNGLHGPAIRTQAGSWVWVDPRGRNPVQGASFAHESWGGDARPVVVIDPEDREQVERLLSCMRGASRVQDDEDNLAAALREFASPTPPKPDEPTGLGAVVEDAEGETWVRAGSDHEGQLLDNWRLATGGGVGDWQPWSRIAAVRVLSEGVRA